MFSTLLLTGGALLTFKLYDSFKTNFTARFHTNFDFLKEKSVNQSSQAQKKTNEEKEAQKIAQGLAISSLSLGLATAGTLVYTPLSIVALVGLLCLALPLGKEAVDSLKKEPPSTPAPLDLLVLVGCVTQGYYVVGALAMCSSYLSQQFWLQQEQEVNNSFFPQVKQINPMGSKEKTKLKAITQKVKVGESITVQAGERVPADGTIIEGMALINQRFLTGNPSPVMKEVGEQIFAGQIVIVGRIVAKIEHPCDIYSLNKIDSILQKACEDNRASQVWMSASNMALSQLGASALAWLVVGPMGGIAIIGVKSCYDKVALIEKNRYLRKGRQVGILIQDSQVLERLNEVNTLVIDQQIASCPEQLATISQLRHRYIESIYLFSDKTLKRSLFYGLASQNCGVNHYFLPQSAAEKANIIANLQADGAMICYISAQNEPLVQKKAYVSIVLNDPTSMSLPFADVLLMDGTLNCLKTLFEMAQRFNSNSKKTFITSLAPNLLAISAPFLFHSGLTTTIVLNQMSQFATLRQAKVSHLKQT